MKAAELTDADAFLFHETKINGYYTVVIPPDGSKEGWEGSDQGDARRDWFIESISDPTHQKGWRWVEVEFGELDTGIPRESRSNEEESD